MLLPCNKDTGPQRAREESLEEVHRCFGHKMIATYRWYRVGWLQTGNPPALQHKVVGACESGLFSHRDSDFV